MFGSLHGYHIIQYCVESIPGQKKGSDGGQIGEGEKAGRVILHLWKKQSDWRQCEQRDVSESRERKKEKRMEK
jgi:hypothetical protein